MAMGLLCLCMGTEGGGINVQGIKRFGILELILGNFVLLELVFSVQGIKGFEILINFSLLNFFLGNVGLSKICEFVQIVIWSRSRLGGQLYLFLFIEPTLSDLVIGCIQLYIG